jgi:hypothetical protein
VGQPSMQSSMIPAPITDIEEGSRKHPVICQIYTFRKTKLSAVRKGR